MVVVQDTLADACSRMSQTLNKLQPKLRISPLTKDAREYLNQTYSQDAKRVKSLLSKICKATGSCATCSEPLIGEKYPTIEFNIDCEEDSLSAKRLVVLCQACNKVSCWSKLMSVYFTESLVESDSSSELGLLIEHFLRVNGHKLSDISVFNATLSLSQSYKLSFEKADVTVEAPTEDDVESFINRLVSA